MYSVFRLWQCSASLENKLERLLHWPWWGNQCFIFPPAADKKKRNKTKQQRSNISTQNHREGRILILEKKKKAWHSAWRKLLDLKTWGATQTKHGHHSEWRRQRSELKNVKYYILMHVCVCVCVCVYNLKKKWYWWTYLWGQNRDTDKANRFMDAVGEGEGGMNWESSFDIYIYIYTTMCKINS